MLSGEEDLRVGDAAEPEGERDLGDGEQGCGVPSEGDGDPPVRSGVSSEGILELGAGAGDDDAERWTSAALSS